MIVIASAYSLVGPQNFHFVSPNPGETTSDLFSRLVAPWKVFTLTLRSVESDMVEIWFYKTELIIISRKLNLRIKFWSRVKIYVSCTGSKILNNRRPIVHHDVYTRYIYCTQHFVFFLKYNSSNVSCMIVELDIAIDLHSLPSLLLHPNSSYIL